MLTILCCILLLMAIVLWQRNKSKTNHPLPPGFFGELPIIGHGHVLLTDSKNIWQVAVTASEYTNRQGGVIYGRLGRQIYYLITDPEDALTVANSCLQKHYIYGFLKGWLGQGLITGSGEVWQRHRKLLNPAFSLPVINGFLGVFNNQAKQLIQNLDPYAGKPAFIPSCYIRSCTLGISCMTAFGNKNVKDKQFYNKYMKAVEDILHVLMERFQKFWLHSDKVFNFSNLRKKQDELTETLTRMSDEVIRVKKAAKENRISGIPEYASTDITHRTFVDIMLEQSNKDELSDREIREELDTTIVAGFETSSNLLEFALVLIGSYPEVQEKMYREITEVVGHDRDVEKEDLQKLVYTDAVIKECLRCLPVVPIIARYIDKEVKLKNYTLRADTQCLIIPYGMHRHPPSWGSDANEFRPERWLDSSIATNAFAAFSIGKRSCAGKTYAMSSSKVILSHIVRTYKIIADFSKMKFKFDITLNPVEGQEITLERRIN